MRWPWSRDPPPLPPDWQAQLGRRLKRAINQAMDDAGIPADDGSGEEDGDQEK